jgi:hypothetical protein
MRSIAIGLLVAGLAGLASSAPAQVDLRWKLNPGEALTIRSRTHFALSLGVEKLSATGALPEMVGDSSRIVRLIPERNGKGDIINKSPDSVFQTVLDLSVMSLFRVRRARAGRA